MGARVVVAVLSILSLQGRFASAEPEQYEAVAEYVGVPPDVLYAMAVTESGMYREGAVSPWPWTLNIEGKAQRYDTRQAMFDGLMDALQGGKSSVDIGLMQVNWYWQYEKLSSPWTITDPVANLKTGASILKEHYEDTGDWWEAVGRYHRPSQEPKHRAVAERYTNRVKKALNRNMSKAHKGG